MKRRFHPAIVGGFVIGGIVLIVLFIIALGRGRLLSHKVPFVIVFPHSVNGLSVGSAVKFKGVPVGEITRLGIVLDSEGNPTDIIAYGEFNTQPFAPGSDKRGRDTSEVLQKAIERGLRARCASDSFITGLLYVDLDIYTNAPPPIFRAKNVNCIEIPVLYEGAADFLRSLDRVNFRRLADQTEQILTRLNQMLAGLDLAQISSSLVQALNSVNELASDPELREAIHSFRDLMNQTSHLLRQTDAQLPSVATNLVQTLQQTSRAVEQLNRTLRQVHYLLQPGTPLMNQLQESLTELTEAIRSVRVFFEQLQENPSAIFRGRTAHKP